MTSNRETKIDISDIEHLLKYGKSHLVLFTVLIVVFLSIILFIETNEFYLLWFFVGANAGALMLTFPLVKLVTFIKQNHLQQEGSDE